MRVISYRKKKARSTREGRCRSDQMPFWCQRVDWDVIGIAADRQTLTRGSRRRGGVSA